MCAESREILSAEVFLDSFGPKVDTADIDAELERLDRALQAYRCDAGMEDYAIAAVCGILAGAVDAYVIKETEVTGESITTAPKKLFECLEQTSENGPKTRTAIPHARIKEGAVDVFPQIRESSRNATPIGLIASLLCRFSDSGMLRCDGEKLHLFPDKISRNGCIWIAGTAVVAGMTQWLYAAADQKDMPAGSLKTLGRLRQIMHASPVMADIVKSIDQWQARISGDIKGCEKNDEKLGIDAIFISLFKTLADAPSLRGSRLAGVMEGYERAESTGISAIPLAQALTQQAVPVILNEFLVRTAYFIVRLARELKAHEDVNDIEWENVMPFGNRTIDRMIAIASVTFSAADAADAAVHAAVESAADHVLFHSVFLKRINVVGIGRAAVAVYRDVTADRQEAELLQRRRMMMEEKTARITELLEAYRRQLEERVCAYIAEDISAFLTGFTYMDRGLVTGDSDMVIKGNVVIQRVLGREPQFTDQREFDELMDSDTPLKL